MLAEARTVMDTIDAIFENGVLRPLKPVPWLREHQRVTLAVAGPPPAPTITDCVGILPDADAREMQAAIDAAFQQVNEDDWK